MGATIRKRGRPSSSREKEEAQLKKSQSVGLCKHVEHPPKALMRQGMQRQEESQDAPLKTTLDLRKRSLSERALQSLDIESEARVEWTIDELGPADWLKRRGSTNI